MIVRSVLWLVLALGCLKLLWNMLVPLHLHSKARSEGSGISLHPELEVALLLVSVAVSLLVTEPERPFSIVALFGWGVGAIVGSYLCMALVAMVLGGVRSVKRRE